MYPERWVGAEPRPLSGTISAPWLRPRRHAHARIVVLSYIKSATSPVVFPSHLELRKAFVVTIPLILDVTFIRSESTMELSSTWLYAGTYTGSVIILCYFFDETYNPANMGIYAGPT